jgi:UTP--glucose-1-phosphate uridylyltransferase
VVEEAVTSGIREIIIITGRGKRAIEDHFDISFELEANLRANGKRKLLKELQNIATLANICYLRQRQALGLGHAVYQAKHLVGEEPFAILLGDDIIDARPPALAQMMRIYEEYHAPVIAVQQVERQEVSAYGIIKGQAVGHGLQRVLDLVEKPTPARAPSRYAVIGRYIMVPKLFEFLEQIRPGRNQEIQLTDALRLLARHQPLYACEIEGKRYDAGDKLGFLKATVQFGLKNTELGLPFRRYLKSLEL